MTLTPVRVGDYWYVTGVTSDSSLTAPLGRVQFTVGAHRVGFDDRFAEPVIVRAYYDPDADPIARRLKARSSWSNVDYIGYMQFMQLRFDGVRIPPGVFGGRLADRQPYAHATKDYAKAGKYTFIDFMGPADAHRRQITDPYYPFNGRLVEDLAGPEEYFAHPRPNGSLCAQRAARSGERSAFASLAAEIAPGFLTRDQIKRLLRDNKPLQTYRLSLDGADTREPYRIALDLLTSTPLAGDDEPPLAGIVESKITAKIVGDYALLTLPDPEWLGPTLCVSTAPGERGSTDIRVHLLSSYDMSGAIADAGRQALWRIREYQLAQGQSTRRRRPAAPGRGRGGLYRPPYVISPDEYALELRYWTVAVAHRDSQRARIRNQYISGFTWSALFRFDEDSGLLTFAAVQEPAGIDGYSLQRGLAAYRVAVESPSGDQVIDEGNFTKAAAVRDDFGGDTRLTFTPPAIG